MCSLVVYMEVQGNNKGERDGALPTQHCSRGVPLL